MGQSIEREVSLQVWRIVGKRAADFVYAAEW
jgi:hypothetical protein